MINILAIEDNLSTGNVIRTELEECGFKVVVSPSAEQALALLKTGAKFDLIILDFYLPGEQGPEFYRWLGMDENFRDIPIIPFTSQLEASSPTANDLVRSYNISKTVNDRIPGLSDRLTSPIVSKGSSESLCELPAGLYVAIATALRKKGILNPPDFRDRLKIVLKTISAHKGE